MNHFAVTVLLKKVTNDSCHMNDEARRSIITAFSMLTFNLHTICGRAAHVQCEIPDAKLYYDTWILRYLRR